MLTHQNQATHINALIFYRTKTRLLSYPKIHCRLLPLNEGQKIYTVSPKDPHESYRIVSYSIV